MENGMVRINDSENDGKIEIPSFPRCMQIEAYLTAISTLKQQGNDSSIYVFFFKCLQTFFMLFRL